VLLGTAITQALSPALSSFTGETASDPVVVPPEPFFAIWGVVITGCLTSALWGLPIRRATTAPYAQIQGPLSLTQIGFSAWLWAAGTTPIWTVPLFVLMLTALTVSLRRIVTTPTDRITRFLLATTVGVYTGWSAAAVWINAATVLPERTSAAPVVLGALLVGAVMTLNAGVVLFRAQPGFVAAGAWALVGVLISTLPTEPALSGVAAAGLAFTGLTAALVHRRHHPHQRRAASLVPSR